MKKIFYKGLSLRIHNANSKAHIWCIHGFGEIAASFSGIENNKSILESYAIRMADLPGCGNSKSLPFETIADTAEILVDAINELSAKSNIILIAHSMGALIGERIAEKLGKRIKLFISIEGFLLQYKERFSSAILQYDDPLQLYDAFVEKAFDLVNTGIAPRTYLEQVLSCTPQALYAWEKSCYAMTSNYVNLNCKRVYMCGSKSAYQPELELLQNAAIDIIQFNNCGHWVMEDADNFYDEVFRLCSAATTLIQRIKNRDVFLETKRCILKTQKYSDLDNLVALRSDPDVMHYIGDGTPQTKATVQDFLSMAIAYQEKHGIGFCMVFEKESGAFVGQAGLFHIGYCDAQSEIEIAYRLCKQFWGKGYATELVKALIEWGFQHLSVNKLIAVVNSENIASQKVLIKSGLDYRGKRTGYDGREMLCYEIYKNDGIELVSYDEKWPEMAAMEIKRLRTALPQEGVLDIQHVGSTAIPGSLAKPVIDIQIAVVSLPIIKPIAVDALEVLGYQYWAENPNPERLFFVKGMPPFGERRTHHVHIVEPSSTHWQGKICFRDYLIAYPKVAREYEALKRKLALKYTYDRENYTEAKSDFINGVVLKAKKTGL